MQNLNFFQNHFGKMASTSYSAVEVLDFLDADSSESSSQSGSVTAYTSGPSSTCGFKKFKFF